MKLFQPKSNVDNVGANRPSFLGRLEFFLSSVFCIHQNPLLSKKKDVLIYGSPRRILRSDGRWWDVYTDSISAELNASSLTLEHHMALQHRKPAKTEDLRYLDILDTLEFFASVTKMNRIRLGRKEIAFVRRLQQSISQKFSSSVNLMDIVMTSLRNRRIQVPFYKLLLRSIRPKLVVIVTSYTKVEFLDVAKNLGIPVVEMQHGMISPYHVGYSFPDEFHEDVITPDFIFTFGDYWNTCSNYAVDTDRIVSVGFPFLDEEISAYDHIRRRRRILFISQWKIGKEIADFAVELVKNPELNHDVVFKLHPRDCIGWRSRYPQLDRSDITVIDDVTTPLYRLFAESEYLVGVYSTAIVEGLMFGLDTFVLDVPGVESMDHLIRAGALTKVKSPQELLRQIEKETESEKIQRERFFKPGATRRISAFLDQLVSRPTAKRGS